MNLRRTVHVATVGIVGLALGLFLGVRARHLFSRGTSSAPRTSSLRQPNADATATTGPQTTLLNQTESDETRKWQAVIAEWGNEADRFWKWNRVFLLAHSALLLVWTSSASTAITLGVSALGMAFVAIWIRANRLGERRVNRWKTLLIELEEAYGMQIVGRFHQLAQEDRQSSTLRTPTTHLLRVQWVLLLVWAFLFLGGMSETVLEWCPSVIAFLRACSG